jgi:hypothetical protein
MDADDIQGISIDYGSPGLNKSVTLLKKSASIKNVSNQVIVLAGKDIKDYVDAGIKPASANILNKTAKIT